MKKIMFIFSIAGGISIILVILIIVLTNPKPAPKTADQTQPTKEVLALMQSANDKNEEAKKILSKAKTTEADQKKAQLLLQEAIDDAKKATEMQSKSPETWFFLSQIYKQLIDINPQAKLYAEEALNKAIALNPDNSKLYQEIATIYIFEKKYQDAENVLKKAIQLDPKDANGYYKLGNVYKEMNEKEKAKASYLQAKKLTPESSKANNAMIDFELKSLDK